jgi:hypothetical protein
MEKRRRKNEMARISVLTALCIILLGFGVPAITVYSSVQYNFNSIVAGIIAVFALAVAGLLAVIGIGLTWEQSDVASNAITPEEKEKLNVLRADQRATLEELDDVVAILKEIRDVLKTAQE